MRTSVLRSQRGFSLLELMIVIAIMALLAGLVVPKLVGRTDDARKAAARTDIRTIENALEMFRLDNSFYPSTEQGLQALITKPTIGREAKSYREGGYLKKVPVDPWKTAYQYISPGKHGEYDLSSLGADGIEGGEKNNADIANWQ